MTEEERKQSSHFQSVAKQERSKDSRKRWWDKKMKNLFQNWILVCIILENSKTISVSENSKKN